MFYKFFCMTHPNRGGHTQKTEKPDFRIRMNRDGSEKKITYIKSYITGFFLCVSRETRFCPKAQNSIFFPCNSIFSQETRFSGNFEQILHFKI